MGRMSITIDDIRHHLEDGSNGYYKNNEEQLFLEDFYKIGFDLKAYDVLDQKIERYPQINFEYDDLKAIITGGDSNYLSGKIKNTIFTTSNYVFKGLEYLIEANK